LESAMLSFFLSLVWSFGSIDVEQLPVARVEQIAHEVLNELQAETRYRPTIMVTERPEPTPLGALAHVNGKCVIVVNPRKEAWTQWGRFLNQQNHGQWRDIIAASVAHELGHCFRENRKFVAGSPLLQEEFRGIQATGALESRAEIIYRQELFADTVALLYAKEHAGEHAELVIGTLIKARERFGANDVTHNTGKILARLLEADLSRHDKETVGEAALRLLTTL